MRIHPIVYGILVVTVFVGIVLGFQAAGVWSTSGITTSDGKQVQPSTDDPSTIKGWMTLEQVSTTYRVSISEILTQFDLPSGTLPSTPLKDLETDTFSADALRTWLQSRMEPAASPPVDSPTAAAPTPQTASAPALTPTTAHEPAGYVTGAITVTAKTTIQDLLDWGVPQEAIQRVLGGPLPPLSTGVKAYVTGQGLEFSDVKAQLQAEADRVK